ncbi:MAG: hypothetical protein ACYS7Y_34055 [Planctomycetota bacterium]
MKTFHDSRPRIAPAVMFLAFVWSGLSIAAGGAPSSAPGPSENYFTIQVVDRRSGRGVPLVELRTTSNIRYITDSNGIVAFDEPGLMGREVFFFVESHGYEFPKDGFGFRGTKLKTTSGKSAIIKIDRLNIAERLYRITGQGIYRDSVLMGRAVPLANPVLNGQVTGQDSVYTCLYKDRLFWLWGDTNRPSYPLGHFWTAGAFSDLPAAGGLDPSVGVNLEYLVDEDGFSRPLCRLKEKGLVWLDGLLAIKDERGAERMVAKYARMKDLGHALERGLVVFNDATESFEPLVRSRPDFLPYTDSGHAFPVDVAGHKYYYFAVQFPLTVRMRVKAEWDCVLDPNRYEVLTALSRPSSLNPRPSLPRWLRAGELIGDDATRMPSLIKSLKKEKQDTHLYDVISGKKVTPHGGSVYFNTYRSKWIMITVQQFGDSSHLGEVWYAEADTPAGPWAYAHKVVTHDKYTFYNPMQHPYFDQQGGRVIYFEGTYSHTFSGSEKNPTPRYDYNQIMYRLDLDDPRLVLPAAIYQLSDKQGGLRYLLRDGAETAELWDGVESVAFYALEPQRAAAGAKAHPTAIYAQESSAGTGLTTTRPGESAKPLFYGLPLAEETGDNAAIASLYEYRHSETHVPSQRDPSASVFDESGTAAERLDPHRPTPLPSLESPAGSAASRPRCKAKPIDIERFVISTVVPMKSGRSGDT